MDIQRFPKTKAYSQVEKHMIYSGYKRIARAIILWWRSLSRHKNDYPCQKMAYANQPESDGTTVPPDFIQQYNSITRDCILRFRRFLEDELEINRVIIPLLEIGVISNEERLLIQDHMQLAEQRKQIISIVLNSGDSSIIYKFLYVLHEIGRDDILEVLLTGQNSTRTNHVEDFDFALSDSVSVWVLPHSPNMVENEQDIDDIAGNILDLRLFDTWRGSVVLRLQSVLQSEEIFNKTSKLEHFLTMMYHDVKIHRGELIDLSVRVIPRNKFIERRKPLDRDLFSSKQFHETGEDICFTCLQEIIRTNVKVLVAEIESDVISETFEEVGDTSTFVQNMCLSTETTPSRQQRALLFLKYALHEKSYLRSFYNIFNRKRRTKLAFAQCGTCSPSSSTSGSDSTSDIKEFKLIFILTREEGVNMVRRIENYFGPTFGPSTITTTEEKKQKTKISKLKFRKCQTETTPYDDDISPPSTPMIEPLMMKHSFFYIRQHSMPDLREDHFRENRKQMEIFNYMAKQISQHSKEINQLKEKLKDRSEQQDSFKFGERSSDLHKNGNYRDVQSQTSTTFI